MRNLLVALLAILFTAQLHAQTSVGVTVIDDTGAPLSGLSVYAFNNATYVNKSAVTSATGVATLTLSDGAYRFRVDKSGTQYFSAASNHCTVPACTALTVTLPRPTEVTVTGNEVSSIQFHRDLQISHSIELYGGSFWVSLFRILPGVTD